MLKRDNEKYIFSSEKLKEYRDHNIRIIITPSAYESVLSDILWLERKYKFNAICLVPRYLDIIQHKEMYHINKLLSYFRGKLLVGNTPTIFCNSCLGGQIYELFDRVMVSPTVNTGMSPEDFIKLCKNHRYYMEKEMKELNWIREFGNPGRKKDELYGKIGDIKIIFGHTLSEEGLLERWNMMRKRVNWERIIFILTEQVMQINVPYKVLKDFFELKGEKLFVNTHTNITCGTAYEHVYMPELYFQKTDTAIENYFDILGWMNREYC